MTKKRLAILMVYVFLASILTPSELAWAYIDPATTTYIIQIATAIVITLGVSLSVFLYKFQMIITNLKVFAHALIRGLSKGLSKGKGGFSKASTPRSPQATSAEGKNEGIEALATGEALAVSLTEEEALAVGIIDYPIPVREHYPALASAPLATSPSGAGSTAKAARGEEASASLAACGFGSSSMRAFLHWLWGDERTLKGRVKPAAFVAAAFSVTFVIFSMLDSVLMNETKLTFSFADVVGVVFGFGLGVFLVIVLVLSLLRGRVFDFMVCLFLSLLICGYLQITFFNSGIGKLIGTPLGWEELGLFPVLSNLLIWVVVFALVFFAGLSRRARVQGFFKRFAVYAPAFLIVIQAVALLIILPPADEWHTNQSGGTMQTLTAKGIYQVSSEENVLVFVLDMLDEDFINDTEAQNPGFFDTLDGFTRFTNNVTQYNTTFPSVINFMTGVPLNPQVTSERYTEEAYSRRSFVADIHDQGYVCGLYMEKPYTYSDGRQFMGIADNLEASTFTINTPKIMEQLIRLSLLKSVPLSLKSQFWIHPVSFGLMGAGVKTDGADPYWSDDPKFYRQLKEERLKPESRSKRFSYYHLNGSHYPWFMDANAQHVDVETTGVEQTKGSFLILEEYFKQMKELGIYKDATIIITGDHPTHMSHKALDKPMLVSLFVKPSGEEGTPLRYNNAPVSIMNLAPTCVAAAGADGTRWGRTYFEVGESEVVERHYFNRFTAEDARTHYIAHYRIVGDARLWENWQLVEMVPYDTKYWF